MLHSKRIISFVVVLLTAAATSVYGTEKRLNNLVVELGSWTDAQAPYAFANPRAGWVFISVAAAKPWQGTATLASADGTFSCEIPLTAQRAEDMRWLTPGIYEIHVAAAEPPPLDVVARAIPELHYCRFPAMQKIPAFGLLDWPFLERHILPHVNTIVGNPTPELDAHVTEWTSGGKKWIGYFSLPHQEGLTGQQAFEYWAGQPGFQDPRLAGLIADEFQGRHNPLYPAWIEGMKLLGASDVRIGRAFYGYCGGPAMYTRPQPREIVRTIFDQGFYMAYERYLHEEPTLEEMRALMDRLLGAELPKWRGTFPGCERQLIMVMGLFAQGFGLNVRPDVDFKVHMDLQMQYLATHPAFKDIFGVHWWVADFSDEEMVRWQGRLYRHYAIEGNTELLSDRYGYVYELGHIKNPDFDHGFSGWRVMPAAIDSVGTDYMERYARLQGRYWHRAAFPDEPAGNTYLWMKRHPQQPNTAMQLMRGLTTGALYSVKMITADRNDILQGVSEEKIHPVALQVRDATVLTGKSFQAAYPSQTWEPFLDKPAWFNMHRLVFRAEKEYAWLTITDWPDGVAPGDNDTGEFMVNFIEVQPYFDPDE